MGVASPPQDGQYSQRYQPQWPKAVSRGPPRKWGDAASALDLHEMQAWRVRDNRQSGLYRHQDGCWLLPCAYARIELQQGCWGADGSHYCLVQENKRWGLYRGGAQAGARRPRWTWRAATDHTAHPGGCAMPRRIFVDTEWTAPPWSDHCALMWIGLADEAGGVWWGVSDAVPVHPPADAPQAGASRLIGPGVPREAALRGLRQRPPQG